MGDVSRPSLSLSSLVSVAGTTTLLASLMGLAVGLWMISAFHQELTLYLRVSESAVAAIDETVGIVEEISGEAASSLTAATDSVSGASSTVEASLVALEGMADLLGSDLPEDLESLHEAMPATIRAASAVDAAVEAVSLFGSGNTTSGGLEDSFMRLEQVLGELPSDLRVQGGRVRSLISPAHTLAQSTDQLALSLEQLREDLTRFEAVSDSYRLSLGEAEAAVEQARGSLQRRTAWLRVLVILASAVGISLGAVLIKTGRDLK